MSNDSSYNMYDCGCVVSRRKNSRYYARRWKVYRSKNFMILRCMDCGRINYFGLSTPEVVAVKFAKK